MTPASIETVVKVGGGLLGHPDRLQAALDAIADAGRCRRLLVVPGGGPFADAVRAVDRQLGLPDATAHWMAVLAMEQYAHLIAARLPGALLVNDSREIAAASGRGCPARVPVLAPYRWLRDADPLPHAWLVTSDSIAAWIAGRVGAGRVVLVKPPGLPPDVDPVDGFFARTLPAHVTPVMVAADRIDELRAALLG